MRTKNIDAIFMVRLRQKEFMHRLQTHTKRMVIESKRNSHYANVHSTQEKKRIRNLEFDLTYIPNENSKSKYVRFYLNIHMIYV